MEQIKTNLAKNLVQLRKSKNLTQLELAGKLNYSDKSISKWEHGDAVPDISVLKTLADFYGVTVDFLINEQTENAIEIQAQEKKNSKLNNRNKLIITLLSTSLVWIIATIVFVHLELWIDAKSWLTFIFALPVSFIVLLVFNSIWGKRKLTLVIVSLLVWTLLLSLYLLFLEYNIWLIFIVGIPFQISIILWGQFK